ncbi:MAG: glycosyltransferase family 4 protein [Planctomycetota bacterium]
MRVALDVRVREGKYSSFVRVTELLEEAAASVGLELELWSGGAMHAEVLWNPLMEPAPVASDVQQVITVHDCSPLLMDPRPKLERWRRARRFRSKFEKAAAAATAFSAVSEHVAQLIRKEFPQVQVPATVVPHYPAAGFVPPESGAEAPHEEASAVLLEYGLQPGFVLFVAALRRHKNWEGALEAWSQLPKEIQAAAPLVLAGGKGRGEARMRKQLQRLGMASSVHILDAVDDRVLRALYGHCGVMVFPSFNEGFGLPPLEAMACGAPVVASDCTAMPEVLGAAALAVDPWSVPSITDGLLRILSDPAEARARRQASVQRAASFGPQRTGEAMKSLLATL